MQLVSLQVSNFRVIKSAHLDFPDSVMGIIGPNGAGKSSLVEAMAWALYGNQVARSSKDEVKATFASVGDSCEVALTFGVHGEQYRVVRRLVGKTERPEVQLFRSGATESVGSTETQHYIAQLLGLDWRGFLTSFLARQQELNALSELAPARRREHLAGMLGIERLDKALQQVKEDTRVNREKAGVMQAQLAQREQVTNRCGQLREHAGELSGRKAACSGAHEAARDRLKQATANLQRETEQKDACSRIETKLLAENRTQNLLTEQRQRLQAEQQTLSKLAGELAELEPPLAELPALKAEQSRLTDARGKQQMSRQLQEQLTSIDGDLGRLTESEEKATAELVSLRKQKKAVADTVEDDQRRLEDQLEQAREAYVQAGAEVATAQRRRDQAQQQMEQIDQIGPDAVCDRCHRPYGSDLPEIRAHVSVELREADGELIRAEEHRNKVRAEGTRMKDRLAQLAELAKQRREMLAREETLLKETEELASRRSRHLARQDQLRQQRTEIGTAEFDPVRLERVERRMVELEQMRTRRDEIAGRLRRMTDVEDELKQTIIRLEAIEREVIRLEQEREGVGFDAERFAAVSTAFNQAQQEAESTKEALLEVSTELEVAEKELTVLAERLESFDRVEQDLESFRREEYYGEKLSGLFADFRKHIIAGIRPRLAELSSDLLSEMTGGRYSLAELDPEYNMRIMDYGQYFGVNRFSGGEKDLANLCLRLAISLALSESAGLDRSFIILDEVFGSQDDERRDLIFDSLVKLKQRFPQILLISHIEEIRHKVETLVQVLPTGSGFSEVRCNGDLA